MHFTKAPTISTRGASRATVAVLLLGVVAAAAGAAQPQHAPRADTSSPSVSAIERGRYLARLGDCASCHTASGGKPFAGGMYLPTPFGQISVPNITPDLKTGIGAWSDEEFYRAMHEGVGRQGEYLYPVFPFPWYTKVTRADVLAIKAYLFSLPAVAAPRAPLKLTWPASVRESLGAWRAAFFTAGEFQPLPGQSPEVNRGAYLVQGLGHCGECHNQHNVAGVSRWSGTLEGGPIEGWYAPNLTDNKQEGLGVWSTAEVAQFLKTGSSPHGGTALGPMQEVVQRSLSHLSDPDLLAIGAYLKSVPGKETYSDRAVPTARVAEGGTYLSYCASCHGVKGQGLTGEIPPLVNNGAVTAQGPQNVIRVVLGGLPAVRGMAPMPAVGASMTDEEVTEAVNYVRNSFGNAAPANAAPGLVAQLRATTRTTLTGDPTGACGGSDAATKHLLSTNHLEQQLADMTEANMLSVIDSALPRVRAAHAGDDSDGLVNGLTAAYCSVLTRANVAPAGRAARLGDFAVLVYGQLKHPDRGQ